MKVNIKKVNLKKKMIKKVNQKLKIKEECKIKSKNENNNTQKSHKTEMIKMEKIKRNYKTLVQKKSKRY